MKQVVIVGAGISGLATAYRLQEICPTVAITVLEQSHRPGGTVWTERQDGFQVEIGPNGFLDNKPFTLRLCRDLELGGRLIPASEASGQNRYLLWNEKLELLPRSLRTFLTTPLLSWRGKLRLLGERWIRPQPSPVPQGTPLGEEGGVRGDESIDAFVRRRGGAEAAEVFADALVTGIYAGDPRLLSLPACFPRLAVFERECGSVIRGFIREARRRRKDAAGNQEKSAAPRMWTFSEGLRLLIETLRDRLSPPPTFGVKVGRLERRLDASSVSWTVQGEGQDRWAADTVILACPAYQQAGILGQLDAELAERIESIVYNRLAVVALGYRRADVPGDLDGFGFIASQRLKRDILGVQWCSSIFPQRAPAGMVLLRAMCGGWNRPDMVGWDDDRLIQAVRAELQRTMRIAAEPVFHSIVRWDQAIPQYHVGHLDLVAGIEEKVSRHPGLFLTGNAYHGVSLNDCTEQAEKVAGRVASFLNSSITC
jgi:oxygen-dependent protoporphyrinogen oxidase